METYICEVCQQSVAGPEDLQPIPSTAHDDSALCPKCRDKWLFVRSVGSEHQAWILAYTDRIRLADSPQQLERILAEYHDYVPDAIAVVQEWSSRDFADFRQGLARLQINSSNSDEWQKRFLPVLMPGLLVSLFHVADDASFRVAEFWLRETGLWDKIVAKIVPDGKEK